MATTGSETREGWLTPNMLMALTRKMYERPSMRPVTGKRAYFTGVSLHWVQWWVPTSHLYGDTKPVWSIIITILFNKRFVYLVVKLLRHWPVNKVAEDGAAALYCRLSPGHHHIIFISVMTSNIKRGDRDPLYGYVSIWHTHIPYLFNYGIVHDPL